MHAGFHRGAKHFVDCKVIFGGRHHEGSPDLKRGCDPERSHDPGKSHNPKSRCDPRKVSASNKSLDRQDERPHSSISDGKFICTSYKDGTKLVPWCAVSSIVDVLLNISFFVSLFFIFTNTLPDV